MSQKIKNQKIKKSTWKIQLTITIDFVSSKDIDEKHVKRPKSDNIEIMIYNKADEFTKELFESVHSRYQ